ncbi:MAG: hypothetical protein MK102_18870 [Fuerstiella sp.]|nr:hypothetical protein [Fuerstiella sp.]
MHVIKYFAAGKFVSQPTVETLLAPIPSWPPRCDVQQPNTRTMAPGLQVGRDELRTIFGTNVFRDSMREEQATQHIDYMLLLNLY